MGQNAFLQSKVFKQAVNIIGEILSDMDKEKEHKNIRIHFLEDKKGIPDSKVLVEMNGLDPNKISNKEKNDGIMSRSNTALINHKYFKI